MNEWVRRRENKAMTLTLATDDAIFRLSLTLETLTFEFEYIQLSKCGYSDMNSIATIGEMDKAFAWKCVISIK